MPQALRWDVFCRVVDNHGDLGVCWRLSSQLAARGHRVRLWVDNASALAWMAPNGAAGVEVLPWPTDDDARLLHGTDRPAPFGDVLIEAFGCNAPAAVLQRWTEQHRQAAAHQAPVWINLEYLSAEPHAARSHGLPSPRMTGPAAGLTQWFFYPGFTSGTGGLLRGQDVRNAMPTGASTSQALTQAIGQPIALQPGERAVSVFTYPHANTVWLLQALATVPSLLLTAPGPATDQVQALLQQQPRLAKTLRCIALPWLAQPNFDALLDACDLNVVRGEDSLARAVWAGRPFLWNIYAQDDGAHGPKLAALLSAMRTDAAMGAAWRQLNHLSDASQDPAVLDARWMAGAQQALRPWWQSLRQQDDLLTQLLAFVNAKRGEAQDAAP